jgi:hypothetical protein
MDVSSQEKTFPRLSSNEWIAVIVVCISAVVYYKMTREKVENTSKKIYYIIKDPGTYELKAEQRYRFDLSKDDSFIIHTQFIPLTLYLPEDAKDGDVIFLQDQPNRYGWGNLLYNPLVICRRGKIVGDLATGDLFKYRQGDVEFLWNESRQEWSSKGQKGTIDDPWSGWYKLVVKGAGVAFSTEKYADTSIVSYLRVDATQNPILLTFYGGTPSYPQNIIMSAITVLWDDLSDKLTFPEYDKYLTSTMNQVSTYFKRTKDGILLSYINGGGWKKDERYDLWDRPVDLEDIK